MSAAAGEWDDFGMSQQEWEHLSESRRDAMRLAAVQANLDGERDDDLDHSAPAVLTVAQVRTLQLFAAAVAVEPGVRVQTRLMAKALLKALERPRAD